MISGSSLISASTFAGGLVITKAAMGEKLAHDEVSRRGGLSKSPAKISAVMANLSKARSKQAEIRERRQREKQCLLSAGRSLA